MAAASSSVPSGISLEEKYEVFLSFSGKDARKRLISHLYPALDKENIRAFLDDTIVRGEHISPSLLSAIDRSKIAVVVFSPCYASSTWCLDELVHIVKCKEEREQIVIPVFYDVQPRDVRWQSGAFGAEFAKLQKRCRENSKTWKKVLAEVAVIAGWDLEVAGNEAELVQNIVKDVREKLTCLSLVKGKGLVGVKKHIDKIKSLLRIGSNDVFRVGIWGTVGVGKSTIATEIYDTVYKQFDRYRFIDNVGERAKRNGLNSLREEVLSVITSVDRNSPVSTKEKSGNKKVFIIFDNVTESGQIEFLIGGCDGFGLGSRIVIISRDEKVLTECRVKKTHKVGGLSHKEGLELFCSCAFGDQKPAQDYLELSARAVEYAKGAPLVLKILGSFLSGKMTQDWENTLKKIEEIPQVTFRQILKICCDGLEDREKKVFLHIAYSLNGVDKDTLQAKGKSSLEKEINALVNKHLITITNNKMVMHELLQDIGREIIDDQSVKIEYFIFF